MVKVKLLTSRCGNGDPQLPGQEVWVDADEAQRLILDHQAIAVEYSAKDAPKEPPKVSEPKPAAVPIPKEAKEAAPKRTKRTATKKPTETRTEPAAAPEGPASEA